MTRDHTASAEDSSAHHWDRTRSVPETGRYILASNLEGALRDAIEIAKLREIHMRVESSSYRAGLEANLAYLRAHGTLDVR